jgi:hypothetical protein
MASPCLVTTAASTDAPMAAPRSITHKNDADSERSNNDTLETGAPASASLVISTAEAMNPSRRNTMEDRHVVHAPGTWKAPNPHMSYLAVYDGHGGIYNVDRRVEANTVPYESTVVKSDVVCAVVSNMFHCVCF